MPLSSSIFAFEEPGGLTVTRRLRGTLVSGRYVANPTTTTFNIRAAVQPAREVSRVTAGRDLVEKEMNQHVYDVRLLHTNTELNTRTEAQDPDTVSYEGSDWTVVRCEPWNFRSPGGLTNDKFWQIIISRKMQGGS